jgi:anti-anti-sigma regulatory factor
MDNTSGSQPVRLPADCSIGAIRSTYEMIRDASDRQQRLEIDGSAVEKADITLIQLLLSAVKTAQAQGRQIGLRAFSKTLRQTLQRAGFATTAAPSDASHPNGPR